MTDAMETELVGVTLPCIWLKQIDQSLKPMQNRQDFIRIAIEEKLDKLSKKEAV